MSSEDAENSPLRRWRKAKGFTQKQVAVYVSAALGRPVSQQSVYWWERGVMPGADAAVAIEKITDGEIPCESFVRSQCPLA